MHKLSFPQEYEKKFRPTTIGINCFRGWQLKCKIYFLLESNAVIFQNAQKTHFKGKEKPFILGQWKQTVFNLKIFNQFYHNLPRHMSKFKIDHGDKIDFSI